MTLASGARLGPYELRSRLGAGGMGEVLVITPEVQGEQQPLTVIASWSPGSGR